jgi:hypothetical protein
MNNTDLDTDIIRRCLDQSLEQIDPRVLARLGAARAAALQRHASAQTHPLRAWLLQHLLPSGPMAHPAAWSAAVVLAVALLGGGSYYWQQEYENTDDIDIAILTDELPLDSYVKN